MFVGLIHTIFVTDVKEVTEDILSEKAKFLYNNVTNEDVLNCIAKEKCQFYNEIEKIMLEAINNHCPGMKTFFVVK